MYLSKKNKTKTVINFLICLFVLSVLYPYGSSLDKTLSGHDDSARSFHLSSSMPLFSLPNSILWVIILC